ncbi:hypothetical protein JCM11491_002364 [Sporobolomyces phaffii]
MRASSPKAVETRAVEAPASNPTPRTSHKRGPDSDSSVSGDDSSPPSLFTNLNPFAVLPQDADPPMKHMKLSRRHSSELRAVAANRFKQECVAGRQDFRRRSLVDVEIVTDRPQGNRSPTIRARIDPSVLPLLFPLPALQQFHRLYYFRSKTGVTPSRTNYHPLSHR